MCYIYRFGFIIIPRVQEEPPLPTVMVYLCVCVLSVCACVIFTGLVLSSYLGYRKSRLLQLMSRRCGPSILVGQLVDCVHINIRELGLC